MRIFESFDPDFDYPRDAVVNVDGVYKIRRYGIWVPVQSKPDSILDRTPKDGRDGVPGPPGKNADPGLVFQSDWKRGKYGKGSVVVLDGQTWIANESTKTKPRVGNRSWSLAAARGATGPAGKDGESWFYHQRIGRKPESTTETHPITVPGVVAGQVVVAGGGLASMANPRVTGVAISSGEYITEGSVTIPGLIPGSTYYLAADIPGAISVTAPIVEGDYVVVIGRATDANTLDIEISQPVLL